MGVSIVEILILAIAVGFLVYAFTGSGRIVATVLFGGLLLLIGAGLVGLMHQGGRSRQLVEVAPVEGRQAPIDQDKVGETRLFDVASHGRSFVFVIDTSAGMGEGGEQSPLSAVKKEFHRALHQLKDKDNSLAIVFYDKEPKYLANDSRKMIVATTRSVAELLRRVDALSPGRGRGQESYRRHWDALHEALKLKPDIIYLVTHGQDAPLSTKELRLLRGWNRRRSVINVVHLASSPQPSKSEWLEPLAQQNLGTYLHVSQQAEREAEEVATVATDADKPTPPDWVNHQSPASLDTASSSGVYRTVLVGKPRATVQGSREAFDEALQQTVAEYAERFVARGAGAKVAELDSAWDYVARSVVKETYTEQKAYPGLIGPMYHLHGRVEFDEQDAAFLRQAWRASLQERRLWMLAAVVAAVLAVVGTVLGYLKLDTATRGYYSGRLKLAAGFVLILLLLLCFAAIRG